MKRGLRTLLAIGVFSFIFLTIGFCADTTTSGKTKFLETKSVDKLKVLVIPIDNKIITPAFANFFSVQMQSAVGYDAIVILIDTPGGFLTACEDMVKKILDCPIPVIAYIYPKGAKAGSAGVFISLACDFIAMSPNTRIGAAHPILAGVEDDSDFAFAQEHNDLENALNETDVKKISSEPIVLPELPEGLSIIEDSDKILSDKILNDTLAFFRSYVKEKRKDIDIKAAEDLVIKSMSLIEEEALQKHIVDAISPDLQDVLDKAAVSGVIPKFKDYQLTRKKMGQLQTFMYYITNPYLLYVLSSLSVILLIFEFTHPGFGVPGIIGLLGLGVCMYGYGMLPVNYLGLFLMILGIIFFILEAFTPGVGILAAGGGVAFLWGSLILWNTPGSMYHLPKDLVVSIAVFLGISIAGIIYLAMRIKYKRSAVGADAMIGKVAEVIEDVSTDAGRVFIMGEYWNAVGNEGVIPKGSKVLVDDVRGLVLVVKKRGE